MKLKYRNLKWCSLVGVQMKNVTNICLDLSVNLEWKSAKEGIRKLTGTFTSIKGHYNLKSCAFQNQQQTSFQPLINTIVDTLAV